MGANSKGRIDADASGNKKRRRRSFAWTHSSTQSYDLVRIVIVCNLVLRLAVACRDPSDRITLHF